MLGSTPLYRFQTLACILLVLLSTARVGYGARLEKSAADVRAKAERIGAGKKAKVKIMLKDGDRVTGVILETGDEDMTVETDSGRQSIKYEDVSQHRRLS